jgi:hypothetical protein
MRSVLARPSPALAPAARRRAAPSAPRAEGESRINKTIDLGNPKVR